MKSNPFAQLLAPRPIRLPKSDHISVVVDGQRITHVRQLRLDDEDERARALRDKLRAAKDAQRYQRERADPQAMAKRQAWLEANREKRRAYKKAYDADPRNKQRQREQKTAWAKRNYHADPDRARQVQREYYRRNREKILAKLQAKREASRKART